MRRIFSLTLAALIAGATLAGCARDKTEYDLFLLIGQSNMAGRGTMLAADTLATIEGVWLLDDHGMPVPAVNPLNRCSTVRKALAMQQIGPGYSFSQTLHRRTGRPILLVVNALGGSSLAQWMPGTKCYDEAVRRAREAMRYGDLRAILWHQGESDSSSPDDYLDRLAVMVSSLRGDLGCHNVPFIAGEIARWHKNAQRFNPVIGRIGSVIYRSDCVSSEGCTPLIDDSDPHFSRDGQLLLGERYAEKVMEWCYE